MNYYNQKCPHCEKIFNKNDDIVVCPVCGTPQHRECYEEENKCVNSHRHQDNYVWKSDEQKWENNSNNKNENNNSTDSTIVCSNCGTENSCDAFYCNHCSAPLNSEKSNTNFNNNGFSNGFGGFYTGNNAENAGNMPFGTMFLNINDEDEIAPDVKIKEANKYVKNNTTFYSFIFKRIHDHNRSRFNFCAFLFSGGWFLYRKQYLLGTILTILMGICLFGYAVFYTPYIEILSTLDTSSNVALYNDMAQLSTDTLLLLSASSLFKIAQYIIMIISGLIANRCYYKHVVKKVKTAKTEFESQTELNTHLDKKGGVDKVLGYILLAGYIILSILPAFLLAGNSISI